MSKQIMVGGVPVGGGAPVSIQSMTNTRTDDVEATLAQIRTLAAAGCQIIRVAVPDMAAAKAVAKIKDAAQFFVSQERRRNRTYSNKKLRKEELTNMRIIL